LLCGAAEAEDDAPSVEGEAAEAMNLNLKFKKGSWIKKLWHHSKFKKCKAGTSCKSTELHLLNAAPSPPFP
jgi:hypothetical protein